MSRGFGRTLAELVNPNWVRHSSVPPLEAGLRPNNLLDTARVALSSFEVDDIALLDGGAVAMSHGREVYVMLDASDPGLLASFDGAVMALGTHAGAVLAAVEGRGLVQIGLSGQVTDLCQDDLMKHCVTAVCGLVDGGVAVAIGSLNHSHTAWTHALVTNEASGLFVLVRNGNVQTLANGLAWPSGVCAVDDGNLLLSLSLAHRIETVAVATGKREVMLSNFPAYPGRLNAHPDGWVVAFPYVRNRLSELLLKERDFVDEMMRTITPDEWMVPLLRNENPYTSALQLGQLRVLGVLKPWAPARSYGLVGVLDHSGRITSSYHSRVEGSQHGVTAAASTDEGILVAVRGSRNVLIVKERIA